MEGAEKACCSIDCRYTHERIDGISEPLAGDYMLRMLDFHENLYKIRLLLMLFLTLS